MGIALDIVFGVLLVFSVVNGIRHGLVHTLAAFIGSIFAFVAAGALSGAAADIIRSMLGATHVFTAEEYNFTKFIAAIILFILIESLVMLAARALDKVAKLPLLNFLNRFLGALLGLLKGVVLSLLLVGLLNLASGWIKVDGRAVLEEAKEGSQFYHFFSLGPDRSSTLFGVEFTGF